MRKILPLIFLITISLKLSFALTPKDIIKQGTRLVYDINKNGNNYELTVIINNISKHYAVDWTLNGSTKLKGNLLLNNDSLDTTYQIFTFDNITPECIIKLNKKIFKNDVNFGIFHTLLQYWLFFKQKMFGLCSFYHYFN